MMMTMTMNCYEKTWRQSHVAGVKKSFSFHINQSTPQMQLNWQYQRGVKAFFLNFENTVETMLLAYWFLLLET